jgi:uncharacterized protein (TIGR04222 family)
MLGPRELANRPTVQRVLRDIRVRLVKYGYLRPWRRRVLLPAVLVTAPPCFAAWLISPGLGSPVAVLVMTAAVGSATWFLPRRTVRGARTLRRLRSRHADLTAMINGAVPADGPQPQTVALAVALFGDAALRALLPTLARGGGLLDGGSWSRRIDEPEPRRMRWE